MEEALALARNCARANLNRIAAELEADSVALVPDAGDGFENTANGLVHRWRQTAIVFRFSDRSSVPQWPGETLAARLDLIAAVFEAVRGAEKLHSELKAANARLATRRIVEQAKGLLQAERGLTEDSAYAWLRGQSRNRRITLAKVAEEIVRTRSSSFS